MAKIRKALTQSLKRWRPVAVDRVEGSVVLLAVNTLPALVLLAAAILRETPIFWRNAGGYSVELRDAIHWGFPPLLVADVVLVAFLVVGVFRKGFLHLRQARVGLVLATIQILLLGVTTERVVHNNIANLWNGRPLHWKPPLPSGSSSVPDGNRRAGAVIRIHRAATFVGGDGSDKGVHRQLDVFLQRAVR